MSKGSLVLVRGLPGSGKSIYAQNRFPLHKHIDLDKYFTNSFGKYSFDFTKVKDAHLWCFEQVREWLMKGKNVTMAATFARLWEMQPYLDLCAEEGLRVAIMKCVGNWRPSHSVSSKYFVRMQKSWEDCEGELEVDPSYRIALIRKKHQKPNGDFRCPRCLMEEIRSHHTFCFKCGAKLLFAKTLQYSDEAPENDIA